MYLPLRYTQMKWVYHLNKSMVLGSREKSVQTFVGHKGKEVNAIFFDELRIASAAEDNKIRIWDFKI